MMGFSGREILLSVLYAFLFGLGYSLLYQLILISLEAVKSLPRLAREILGSEKIFPSPSIKKELKDRKFGAVFAFFSVFLFFVGFLLLSYLALDGQLRLYIAYSVKCKSVSFLNRKACVLQFIFRHKNLLFHGKKCRIFLLQNMRHP